MKDMFTRFMYGAAYGSNAIFQKAATAVLGFFLAYLSLLWLAAGFDVRWLATGTMWLGSIILTLAFWQPLAGGILSLGEFLSVKDDPNKKSVLRGFLLLFIAAVFAGNVAILLGVIGSGEMFPYWILGFLCILAIGASRLEIWLPRIAALMMVMAAIGTMIAIDPLLLARVGVNPKAWEVTRSEKVAKEIADDDLRIIDERRSAIVEYVKRLKRCELSSKERVPFSAEQKKAYDDACQGPSNAVTLDEVRQYWPGLHEAWIETYGRGAFAGAASEPPQDGAKNGQSPSGMVAKVQGWGQQYGWPVVIALLVFHIWLLIWGGGKLKEKYLSSDSKEETPAKKSEPKKKDDKKSSGFPTKTLLAIAALGGGAYYWPDIGPVVQNVPAQARSFYEEKAPAYFNTRQPRLGVITPENVRFWRASPNFNVGLELDPVYSAGAGLNKDLTLSDDSRTEILADSVLANGDTAAAPSGKMYVVLVANPSRTSIVLGGPANSSCARWSRSRDRCVEHIGAWHTDTRSGHFLWKWNDSLMTAKIYLFEGDERRNPLAEFLVRFASELQ